MSNQPIIIKKKKKGGHGHHGGAWKVAYADFVTAMMAFFLLLWLLNAVSQEQLEGISDYFAPISTRKSTSGGGGLLQGKAIDSRGVFEVVQSKSPQPSTPAVLPSVPDHNNFEISAPSQEDHAKDSNKQKALAEQKSFEDIRNYLLDSLKVDPELRRLASSIIVENTKDGLLIEILDQEGLPMFPRGSSDMFDYARNLINLISSTIREAPQSLVITGHTDSVPYANSKGYSNWELSVDRANSARRALVESGIPNARFARIVGKADTEPLIPSDPQAPANRRLTILLLRQEGSPSSGKADSQQAQAPGDHAVFAATSR